MSERMAVEQTTDGLAKAVGIITAASNHDMESVTEIIIGMDRTEMMAALVFTGVGAAALLMEKARKGDETLEQLLATLGIMNVSRLTPQVRQGLTEGWDSLGE